jgi:5-methylcytosine-specific restriction endonuclease McrA
MTSKPAYLEDCEPNCRTFPDSWKTAYWRLYGGTLEEGYECPLCKKKFKGHRGFAELHADHKKAVANGGLTTWENLRLLCGPCNLKKSKSVMQ